MAPLRRRFAGAITPTIWWIHYADDVVAPLRRQSGGSITPTMKWLLYADDSQAGLALLVARLNDARKLHRENVAAGNLALLTLRDQINDFLDFRKQYRHDVANPFRGPAAPVYMLAQPSFQAYAESAIDFPSLTFLMERRKHIPKLNSLVYSAKLYRNLVKLEGLRNASVLAMQEKLAEVEHTNPARTAQDIERLVGPLLIANTTAAIVTLAFHARDDENVYRQAVSELREALFDTLGPWWWPNWLRKCFPKLIGPALISFTDGDPDVHESAMPAWPKKLLSEMKAQEEAGKFQQSSMPPSFAPKYPAWNVAYYSIVAMNTQL